MIKKILSNKNYVKPYSPYLLIAFSLIALSVLTAIITVIYIARISLGQDVSDTLYSIMKAVPLGVGIAMFLSFLLWAGTSIGMSDDESEDKAFDELCLSPEKILKYELVETYGDFITLGITFKDNNTINYYRNLKALKAFDTLKNTIDRRSDSYQADPHDVVIDNLIREFRDYAAFRAKDVARGAETPHLAGLLVQKHGAGLMQALSVVYRSNRAADKLGVVIDQETIKIDPDYKEHNKSRWEMRPADILENKN